MNNYKELIVWQKARMLVKSIYSLSTQLPSDEKFGLVSQIRRCAVSIPSNIAEGASRTSNKEFAYFLEIAYGSSFELETQLLLCSDIEFLPKDAVNLIISELQEIQKMIYNLIKNKKCEILNQGFALILYGQVRPVLFDQYCSDIHDFASPNICDTIRWPCCCLFYLRKSQQ